MIKAFFTGKARKPIIGLLVAALVVGGISAQATGVLNTPSGGYLLCVNSKTKVITHPGTVNCPKGSKKLTIGAAGKDGKTLWNGEKDPENTLGSTGDMFINSVTKTLFGPKNLDGTWPAGVSMVGPKGDQGPGGSGSAGPAGAPGANGTNATIAITELFLCDGPDAGTVADEKCKIGMTGPGGGTIFFVDYNDQYVGWNYLEAAPKSCEAQNAWSSDTTHSLLAVNGWVARAVGSGQTNTTAMLANGATSYVGDTSGAAFYSNALASGIPAGCVTSKDDWFLGSLGEMKLMYDNLQGVGGFVETYYWSSNDADAGGAWAQYFGDGGRANGGKGITLSVRPVRVF